MKLGWIGGRLTRQGEARMEKYLAEQSSQVPVEAKKTDPMRMLMTKSMVNTAPASGCKWKAMESGS